VILRAVPPRCARALDVGCGAGLLTHKLAQQCDQVIGIDADAETLALAASPNPRVSFIEADVMTYPFAPNSFDFIAVLATLHHLPLTAALQRFKELLKPAGVLAVIGLYKLDTGADFASAAIAKPTSLIIRMVRTVPAPNAPIREPDTTLRSVRAVSSQVLPGAVVRRRLFFRYSLLWRKP
jgi:SAM-dependent methyltransferase